MTRMPRVEAPEWLDQGRGTPEDAAQNLAEMWRLNRWLGGQRALTRHLYPRLARRNGSATVLDLGTGGAEGARAIATWGRRRGLRLRIIGVDWAARNLAAASSRGQGEAALSLLQADALRLPLAGASVDYVISTLFLHHFAPDAAVELLRRAWVHARRGLIFSDLVRGNLPALAFRFLRPLFARHPFTRHDGEISIRRAYTPAEARKLAQDAGIPRARVYTHWPWRLTLVVDRPE
jgi:SAM-dependent methyltransferase